MAYGTKTFMAQQSGASQIKIFESESGTLSRVIQTPGSITTPPNLSGDTMTVGYKSPAGTSHMATYKGPHFGLTNTVNL